MSNHAHNDHEVNVDDQTEPHQKTTRTRTLTRHHPQRTHSPPQRRHTVLVVRKTDVPRQRPQLGQQTTSSRPHEGKSTWRHQSRQAPALHMQQPTPIRRTRPPTPGSTARQASIRLGRRRNTLNIKRIATTILATIGAKQLLLRTLGKAQQRFYTNILGDEYTNFLQRNKKHTLQTMRQRLTELADMCDRKGECKAGDYARLWIGWIDKIEGWSRR